MKANVGVFAAIFILGSSLALYASNDCCVPEAGTPGNLGGACGYHELGGWLCDPPNDPVSGGCPGSGMESNHCVVNHLVFIRHTYDLSSCGAGTFSGCSFNPANDVPKPWDSGMAGPECHPG